MRVLMFGTCYASDPAQRAQIYRWSHFHRSLNPGCDLLLVDSASPGGIDVANDTRIVDLGDNIGHLARGGRDGWGRAFCVGLEIAVRERYDYVAHVESDSLFRLPLVPIAQQMLDEGIQVASVPVAGTKRKEQDWVETGLMIFNVPYLIARGIVDKYDWTNGASKKYPRTPEWHLHAIVRPDLRIMPWSAERGDRGQITPGNAWQYDWITHVSPDVQHSFINSVLA